MRVSGKKFDPNLTQKLTMNLTTKSAVRTSQNSLYQFIPVSVQMYRKIPQALIFQGLRDPNRPDIPGHQKMHLIGIEPTHAAPEATALSTELQMHL